MKNVIVKVSDSKSGPKVLSVIDGDTKRQYANMISKVQSVINAGGLNDETKRQIMDQMRDPLRTRDVIQVTIDRQTQEDIIEETT